MDVTCARGEPKGAVNALIKSRGQEVARRAFFRNCGATVRPESRIVIPAQTLGETITPPATPNAVTLAWRRSPFQVLLLDYATFGLYSVYWLVRGRRLAEYHLERKPTSYWGALLMLVPIVGFFVVIDQVTKISQRVSASRCAPAVPLGLQALAMFIIAAFWRMPDPAWLISLFSSLFLATMHSSVANAERQDWPAEVWPPLSGWEKTIVIVGFIVTALAMYGLLLPPNNPYNIWFIAGVLAMMLLSLGIFWKWSERYRQGVPIAQSA